MLCINVPTVDAMESIGADCGKVGFVSTNASVYITLAIKGWATVNTTLQHCPRFSPACGGRAQVTDPVAPDVHAKKLPLEPPMSGRFSFDA